MRRNTKTKIRHLDFLVSTASKEENLKLWQAIGLLAVLGLFSYGNAIYHPFVHDDVVFIQSNPNLDRFDDVPSLFLHSSKSADDIIIINAYYRPLLEILYKTQHFFFGLNPHAFHIFNILLHITNSILVYAVAGFLLKNHNVALGIAAIFLVHPVQSEAVACIVGVSNLLYGFFILAGFYCYGLSGRTFKGTKAYVLYGLSLGLFVLGVLTKEQGLIFFFLIVLYEFCFCKSGMRLAKPNIFRLSGIGILFLGYLFLRKAVLHIALPPLWDNPQELFLRLLSIPKTLLLYLKILVFPTDLHYYRCLDILQPWFWPFVILGGLIAGGIYGLKALFPEERRLVAFGLGWFLLALFPVLNIAPLIVEYSYIMTSDHFLYLPILGFLIAGYAFFRRWPQIVFQGRAVKSSRIVLACLVFIFSLMTIRQNSFWRGETALFERTIQFESKVGRIQILLAKAYLQEGRFDQAITHFQIALGILQGYAEKTQDVRAKNFYQGFIKEIYIDLGLALEAKGDSSGALTSYEEAIALDSGDSVVYNNVGTVYMKAGQLDAAIEAFQKSLDSNPDNVFAMNNLAVAYIYQKQYKKAEEKLRQAIAIDPGFIDAKKNLERLQRNEKF